MLDTSKIYNTIKNGKFKITNYNNAHDVTVMFIDTGYIAKTRACQVKSGHVKDKLLPNVYGVGFVGDGKYKPSLNSKATKQYSTWTDMILRCYCAEFNNKNKTYRDVTVCAEWHNFQNFAEWFDANYNEGMHLDKDIKIDGNKVYSPESCLFVSQTDNAIKARAKTYLFRSPLGEVVEIYNLLGFCRDNNLPASNMSAVNQGADKSCKGWTKYA